MNDSRELPTDTFLIAVDRQEIPGKVVLTEVVIRKTIVDRAEFDRAQHRVHLCTHPLYPRLQFYVGHNEHGKKTDFQILGR